MNPNHKPSRLLITGPSGSGKTTLALSYAKRWAARWRFVFDHDEQMASRLEIEPAWLLAGAGQQVTGQGRTCVYDPTAQYGADTRRGFEAFCGWTFEVSAMLEGVKLLIVEELDFVVPAAGNLGPAFASILRLGRRRELDLLAITQSPAGLHRDLRNQFTHIETFRFNDPLPREWLRQSGVNLDELDTLRTHETLRKNCGAQ
ncbi:MAG TPA: ATP-binding protein [Terracidiphilus sp.]|jgi:hypothetical protein|nr:ATP-binding protein [Terracidiphilus sp.]